MPKKFSIPEGWRRLGPTSLIREGDEGIFFVSQTGEENRRIPLDQRHWGRFVGDTFTANHAIIIRKKLV
jgi:hypothetical protein